jgi:uncharacterized protein (TIRG00374 family)
VGTRFSTGRLVDLARTRYFRIGVSIALIAYLLFRMNLTRAGEVLESVQADFFVLALVTFAASLALGSVQWDRLLRVQGIRIYARKALSFYYVGAFFNTILPSNIGGDVVRVYDVYRESGRSNEAIAATVTDRMLGLVALGLLAMPSGIYLASLHGTFGPKRGFGTMSILIVLAFVVLLVFAFLVLMNRTLARSVARLLRPVFIRGTRERAKSIYESFHLYRGHLRALGGALSIALAVQVLRVLVHYEVSLALGLDIDIIYFFLFIPVIAIFIALPVSIGGLGVREGLGVILFCGAVRGLAAEQAFAMELLAGIVGVLVSLIGGVIYLRRGFAPYRIDRDLKDGRLADANGD